MIVFRLTSQVLLLAYAAIVIWLAWDIWLLTPHPSRLFKELLEGGVLILLLPPLWSWLTWQRGAIAAANVCAGTVLWFLAAVLGLLCFTHMGAPSVCHAWQAGHTTMVPRIIAGWHAVIAR